MEKKGKKKKEEEEEAEQEQQEEEKQQVSVDEAADAANPEIDYDGLLGSGDEETATLRAPRKRATELDMSPSTTPPPKGRRTLDLAEVRVQSVCLY